MARSSLSKTLIPGHQQQDALAAHFDFTSFSAWPFLDSWPQLFLHQGCFGWDVYIHTYICIYIHSLEAVKKLQPSKVLAIGMMHSNNMQVVISDCDQVLIIPAS